MKKRTGGGVKRMTELVTEWEYRERKESKKEPC